MTEILLDKMLCSSRQLTTSTPQLALLTILLTRGSSFCKPLIRNTISPAYYELYDGLQLQYHGIIHYKQYSYRPNIQIYILIVDENYSMLQNICWIKHILYAYMLNIYIYWYWYWWCLFNTNSCSLLNYEDSQRQLSPMLYLFDANDITLTLTIYSASFHALQWINKICLYCICEQLMRMRSIAHCLFYHSVVWAEYIKRFKA